MPVKLNPPSKQIDADDTFLNPGTFVGSQVLIAGSVNTGRRYPQSEQSVANEHVDTTFLVLTSTAKMVEPCPPSSQTPLLIAAANSVAVDGVPS
jgi:hypothetical protein